SILERFIRHTQSQTKHPCIPFDYFSHCSGLSGLWSISPAGHHHSANPGGSRRPTNTYGEFGRDPACDQ
ncbi:MAG TPA: hypothetical protein VLD65_12200, partial [Anaerolineales bacterium]|nr:hypothetical protein [Anaerolineales bacterium]